jgi:hypothetical protein
MTDKYEVTMMYRVHVPDGTEDTLTKEFGEDRDLSEVLTELISEAMYDYHNTTETGLHASNWVYLRADHSGELWSTGWYNIDRNMPEGWERNNVGTLSKIMNDPKHNLYIRAIITDVHVSNMSWIWEGEE